MSKKITAILASALVVTCSFWSTYANDELDFESMLKSISEESSTTVEVESETNTDSEMSMDDSLMMTTPEDEMSMDDMMMENTSFEFKDTKTYSGEVQFDNDFMENDDNAIEFEPTAPTEATNTPTIEFEPMPSTQDIETVSTETTQLNNESNSESLWGNSSGEMLTQTGAKDYLYLGLALLAWTLVVFRRKILK